MQDEFLVLLETLKEKKEKKEKKKKQEKYIAPDSIGSTRKDKIPSVGLHDFFQAECPMVKDGWLHTPYP